VRARSGREALKEVLDQDFALILLDVVMPGVDGYETAVLIRERPRSRQAPIIFLTANDWGAQHVFRGYTVGAVDYLVKPVAPDVLRSKVAVFVELFNKQEALRIAQGELESRIADRTRELQSANSALSVEIEERSRIEQERVILLRREEAARMEAEAANRRNVIEDAIKSLLPVSSAKNIQIHRMLTDDVQVCGDRDRLQQMVRNLVSNALKFTPKNGRVDVELCAEDGDRPASGGTPRRHRECRERRRGQRRDVQAAAAQPARPTGCRGCRLRGEQVDRWPSQP